MWFSPLSQSTYIFSDYRRLLHCYVECCVAFHAWLMTIIFLLRFILALEGSCCVDCLSDRLSLSPILFFVIFPVTGTCNPFYFIAIVVFWHFLVCFFPVPFQTQYASKAVKAFTDSFCTGGCDSGWGRTSQKKVQACWFTTNP